MRAIPDVSYAADPAHGFSVYHKPKSASKSADGWYVVGGTSAGAPQWAAIQALGHSTSPLDLYDDKFPSVAAAGFFRDIVSGKNGDCAVLLLGAQEVRLCDRTKGRRSSYLFEPNVWINP